MRTLRIGFLGTGGIAQDHAHSVPRLPEVKITALCNRRLDKAKAFNAAIAAGQAACYDDFQMMLQKEQLDALYICMPPGAHDGQAEAAAAKGIHLMLEKPIALTAGRAESIAAAVRKAGVVCQIGHHMRHTAPVRKLKQMLLDGSAGRPVMMQARFLTNNLFPQWWRDPNIGGGQLIEQAIHLYDLARHFLGQARTITAFADNLLHHCYEDYKVDDVSASTIRFANGAIAGICASNCANPAGHSIRFTVLCQKVMAEFIGPDEATFIIHGGKPAEELHCSGETVVREVVNDTSSSFDELSADFLGAVRDGHPTRSTIEDGLNGLLLVLAAAKSARMGGVPQAMT